MSVDVRPITHGPAFHWFGYYDKLQFDPSNRFVLCMEVDFEGRSPTVDDRIRIGMIDRQAGDKWTHLGETGAWCWQQGCMLQWIPGSDSEIVYNDRDGSGFRAQIVNVETGAARSIPHPVYALSPDGKTAVSLDFARTGRLRPGYGYAGTDAGEGQCAPADQGIYRVDLQTGEAERIITLAQIAALRGEGEAYLDKEQWVNHLLVSPDGTRFVFLHRWTDPGKTMIRGTRMFTAGLDGSDIRLLHDGGSFSHFIWRDPQHILAWAGTPKPRQAYYLIDEKTGEWEVVGRDAMTLDGHCTVLPGGEWIVNDAYAVNGDRTRKPLYLYHPATDRRIDIAVLHSPAEYVGEWRCDLHPRHSRDGAVLTIDSTHEGNGRQLYLLDIRPCLA